MCLDLIKDEIVDKDESYGCVDIDLIKIGHTSKVKDIIMKKKDMKAYASRINSLKKMKKIINYVCV